jgi:hypothetical protein
VGCLRQPPVRRWTTAAQPITPDPTTPRQRRQTLLPGPCPKSQPGQIQASHRRDESVSRELRHEFLCDSWHCDRGMIWSKPRTKTTGRSWQRGSFFFQKRKPPFEGQTARTSEKLRDRDCDSRQNSIRAHDIGNNHRSPNEAFSGTRRLSTNGWDRWAAGKIQPTPKRPIAGSGARNGYLPVCKQA